MSYHYSDEGGGVWSTFQEPTGVFTAVQVAIVLEYRILNNRYDYARVHSPERSLSVVL